MERPGNSVKQTYGPPKDFNFRTYLEKLENHHQIFSALASLVQPNFYTTIERAGVAFNNNIGRIELLINPTWFSSVNLETQLFAISHEALHVLFHHIYRGTEGKYQEDLANIAQDIVINELLITEFGFLRNSMTNGDDFCFIDTVFTKETIQKEKIENRKNFEYYYDILKRIRKQAMGTLEGEGRPQDISEVDPNGKPTSSPFSPIPDAVVDDLKNQIEESLDAKAKEEINRKTENATAGKGKGGLLNVSLEDVKKVAMWEKIAKQCVASLIADNYEPEETFLTRPRRIQYLPDDMFIPIEVENQKQKHDKFNIKFFFDCSGSCIHLKQKFFNIVRSIPKDLFLVDAYSFDTSIHKINLNNPRVYGGGGTSFHIIERAIQRCMKNKDDPCFQKYPDLVFVLTDGEGDSVTPEKPERWIWILTPSGKSTYIDKRSKKISISTVQK